MAPIVAYYSQAPPHQTLPTLSRLLRWERWQALSAEQLRGFPPLCPDLVIELASTIGASPSDQGPRGVYASRRKMAVYMANGARLGWLLFPEQRAVEICPADGGVMEPGEPLRNEPALTLEGGELLPGLRLELAEMWSI
jgi:Uma2 family endonuclease